MPTSVARVGSNLPNGNFLPEIWSKKLNAKFYASTSLWQVCNRDWEGEIKSGGSQVQIRIRPTVIVSDHLVDDDITYQDLDDTKVTLAIDKAKRFAFKVDDIDKAQSDINIINETTSDAAEQMKIAIEKQVYAAAYADAGSTVTSQQVTAANVLAWIVDGGTKLDEKNVPTEGRKLIVSPWIAGMIKKSDLKDASISGDGTSILRNGRLGMIDRFEVFVSNNLSGASTAGSPLYCMACTKHAIAFAAQVTKVETLRLQTKFGDAVRGLNSYGFKVVQGDALVSMPAYK